MLGILLWAGLSYFIPYALNCATMIIFTYNGVILAKKVYKMGQYVWEIISPDPNQKRIEYNVQN